MPNRLAREPSPYLQQHKDNPVNWFPWGEDAFETARQQDKPLLVSIGYSSCHWCHVMAHESFENEHIASFMNKHFVNIKVDREERPDVDNVFMNAVQAILGHGGWPLNAFATPDGVPFFGGTYWPPTDQRGMPGFSRVLDTIAGAWRDNRDELLKNAANVRHYLEDSSIGIPRGGTLTPEIPRAAIAMLQQQFDADHGGFGGAPKFPQAPTLDFLNRHVQRTGDPAATTMLTTTLDHMASGGMYDQLGGGFARYSVDERWLVPHFEKMLYDNAQLLAVYTEAWKTTRNERYREVMSETGAWLLDEMALPGGGFASALDADTEGEEGRFYVWDIGEIDQLLDVTSASLVRERFGITPSGNFEGHSVLALAATIDELAASHHLRPEQVTKRLDDARNVLKEHRDARVRPGRDDKLVTAWNGMAIGALAHAGTLLPEPSFVTAAQRAATFILDQLQQGDGSLWRTWRDGEHRAQGVLEDYACLAEGLIRLHQADGNPDWLVESQRLMDHVIATFGQEDAAVFFDTPSSSADLVVRPRTLQDNATPAGNSVAADVLISLSVLTGEERYRQRAQNLLKTMTALMTDHPTAFGRYLAATERLLAPGYELILAASSDTNGTDPMTKMALSHPSLIFVAHAPAASNDAITGRFPLLADRAAIGGTSTAYLCREGACKLPAMSTDDLEQRLREMESELASMS